MPVKSEKSFRTAMVGGFNRQDVLEYISASAREHQSEIEAYRAGADKLRGERDELRGSVEELSGQRERADGLERELAEMKRAFAELERVNARLSKNQDDLQAEISRLSLRILDYENDERELGDARLRAEELEMKAYRRAEEIESEAAAEADGVRREAQQSVTELREKLEGIRSDAEKAAYQIVLELDKMRAWYAHYGDSLQDAEDRLGELSGEERPAVREFVPQEFS